MYSLASSLWILDRYSKITLHSHYIIRRTFIAFFRNLKLKLINYNNEKILNLTKFFSVLLEMRHIARVYCIQYLILKI